MVAQYDHWRSREKNGKQQQVLLFDLCKFYRFAEAFLKGKANRKWCYGKKEERIHAACIDLQLHQKVHLAVTCSEDQLPPCASQERVTPPSSLLQG